MTLNPHARFASFVVGSSNRLAVTAAKAVAETPGAAYNPLFIYARPGLGKTHLLSAIGHEAMAVDQRRTVEYVTVDDFVEAYHAALAAGQAETYRRRFTQADLVLVDDAQLLSNRRELQSELLRLIDVLAAADRQMVLASDRPPEEIQALDERLIRRFAGGLVIDIGVPDYETRLAIVTRRAAERQVVFEPETLAAVADAPIDTVRELLGALNRLIAQQAVLSVPLRSADAVATLAALGHARPASGAPVGRLPDTPNRSHPDEPRHMPVERAEPTRDEFSDLLSEVSATVAQQVDDWRRRVTEAALRYAAEGFRTSRLDRALATDIAADPDALLHDYERDVATLRELQGQLALTAPSLLDDAALHDPDRLRDAAALVEDARHGGEPLPRPVPTQSLATFFTGPSMASAMQAVREAADAPGTRYNPVVIVGRSGAGKTHLLNAFGNALHDRGLGRVAVLTGRQFLDGLVTALAEGSIDAWRRRLRQVDALLVDDVSALAGKERSQEELYLLHNILLESERQMAFTLSVPPAQLSGMEPRLVTRLAGGLVLELPAPEREARIEEVTRLLGSMASDTDLVEYLASRQASTMRDVQQLVQRMLVAADERQVPLGLDIARAILEGTSASSAHGRRHHGVVAPGSGAVRSREKMIETWPDLADRLMEHWR